MTATKSRVKAGKGPWATAQTAPMRSLIPLVVCTFFATALFMGFPVLRADDPPTPRRPPGSEEHFHMELSPSVHTA
jgi:hypothetical protein